MPSAPKQIPAPFSGADYHRNEEEAENPCAVCGRDVGSGGRKFVEVVGGGARFSTVGAADVEDPGYMGFYAVGSGCARRFPPEYLSDSPARPVSP